MTRPQAPAAHWRLAGGLALAHVVLMLAGLMLQRTPALREGVSGITRSYAEGDLGSILTGGFIELLGFLCLPPVLVFLAMSVGRRTETGRWAATAAAGFGLAYVAVTVAAGLPPGAAALWGVQHGLDAATALVVNDIRNFGYFLSLPLLGGHALGLAVAALSDRRWTHWAGGGGILTGLLLLAAPPAAAAGLQDYPTLVWLAWWVGLAVLMLRHRPDRSEPVATQRLVRQA